MRKWIKHGKKGKPSDMRYLLRDYVLFLTNSGLRHGTETYNLKWKHINIHKEKGGTFVTLHVTKGKTGPRVAVVRPRCVVYLTRILERACDMQGLTFEETIKRDEYVFRLPDGTRTKHLDQTFRKLLRDTNLILSSTDQNRSLYSLRHFYITQAILNNKASPALIAKQCGTSILMLEKHYFHLDVVKAWKELTT